MNTLASNDRLSSVLTIFALSICTLTLELTISRLSVFYLDYGSSFIAIPMALLGLALGSLYVHLFKKMSIINISVTVQIVWVFVLSVLALATVFYLFSSYFPIQRNLLYDAPGLLFFRVAIFILVFLPAFFFMGKTYSVLFAQQKDIIGKIYAADLAGAACACIITPLFLHFLDLPYLIFFYFFLLSLAFSFRLRSSKWKVMSMVLLLCVSVVTTRQLVSLESQYEISELPGWSSKVEEIAHRWNEYSRVSVVKTGSDSFRIIHDNAESNVYLAPYPFPQYQVVDDFMKLPFTLKGEVPDILVMFAGCGKQMVEFDDMAGGKSRIDGVEINPLVKEFALTVPELQQFNMKAFYAEERINLYIEEGRDFLRNNTRKYDLIYAASDAATFQYKSGHSRKYLDTKEAMIAYLDHLKDDGMLVFYWKPAWPKVVALKAAFEAGTYGDFTKSVVVMNINSHYFAGDGGQHLVVKKGEFNETEIKSIRDQYRHFTILYAPYGGGNHDDFERYIERDDQNAVPAYFGQDIRDDKPYMERLMFENFRPIPDKRGMGGFYEFKSWVKIETLFFIALIPVLILGGLYVFNRKEMPPLPMFTYLLFSGFSYMVVQIVFIGKLELFLGSPLLSMALLIGVFLLTNAGGSFLFERLGRYWTMRSFPFIAALVVTVCYVFINICTEYFMGYPLFVRLILSILLISPAGFVLGVFYPSVVSWLGENGYAKSIPISYGISTLSSVLGATYAMTLIINAGYVTVFTQGIVIYIVLGLLMSMLLKPVKLSA